MSATIFLLHYHWVIHNYEEKKGKVRDIYDKEGLGAIYVYKFWENLISPHRERESNKGWEMRMAKGNNKTFLNML